MRGRSFRPAGGGKGGNDNRRDEGDGYIQESHVDCPPRLICQTLQTLLTESGEKKKDFFPRE